VGLRFGVRENAVGGRDFEILDEWSPAMRDAFYASGADGLIANSARGFSATDIGFVRDLPLRRLDLLDRGITDLTPIHDLGGTLEALRLTSAPGSAIDLALLPGLRVLGCAWAQVAESIDRVDRLEDVYLEAYTELDLSPLRHLTSLRSVRMKDRPKVRSLSGIEGMPWLVSLEVSGAPLGDTSALARVASPVLQSLVLGSCRKLTSLADLSGLIGLEELDVSESGRVASLRPLLALTRLQRLYLYGSTNIEDGDLTPLLSLRHMQDLRMMDRRHYSPSVSSVRTHLGLSW